MVDEIEEFFRCYYSFKVVNVNVAKDGYGDSKIIWIPPCLLKK